MVVWREKSEDNGVSFASSPTPPKKKAYSPNTQGTNVNEIKKC